MVKAVAYFGLVFFVTLFFAPAALVFAGWKQMRANAAVPLPQWRRACLLAGLIAVFGAWMLLASLELPLLLFRDSYEYLVAHEVWHRCVMTGLWISVAAIPLALLGAARARLYALIGALGVCYWWSFLAVFSYHAR